MHESAIDQSLENTKNVFSSALRFAMSIDTLKNTPELAYDNDELKTSAQEQVEFMLTKDEEVTRILIYEEEVKSIVRLGISNIISSLLECPDVVHKTLDDIEWLCKILPKMEMMEDLVFKWADVSSEILTMISQKKCCKLDVKVKLVEVTGKVLESVGYGIVIVPCRIRVCLVKLWLPFIRRLKKCFVDDNDEVEEESEYKMDEVFCEFIEGSMVSLVLTLPSEDQAEVFCEWMSGIVLDGVKFPDLSEAFEVWCYRSKSAKRRLLEKSE